MQKDKSNSSFIGEFIKNLNSSFEFNNFSKNNISLEPHFDINNEQSKKTQAISEFEEKNPYLKIDDVPELNIIDENIMIYEKKEYKIIDYIKQINCASDDFLDNEYDFCGNCKENKNKYFCRFCNKNICNLCYDKCKIDNHDIIILDNKIFKNNINEIKKILYNNIIPIKEETKLIKDIVKYINKYIIDNEYNKRENFIHEEFRSMENSEKNEDILLIHQIISNKYINYLHYKNIEKILNYLKRKYNINCNNEYEGYGKIFFENGEYYIGEFKNSLRNGKGICYYKNEKIILFGDIVDDKFKGSGNIEYQLYDYYIGEWKDGLRNGKGILNFTNKCKYEGYWVDNKAEGNGKYNDINEDYYIGQWKNNLPNGKGILYNKNGNINYEGDWVNNKKNGNGKIIFDNGDYYIGHFKNDLQNEKGILYDKNGNIKYEGDYTLFV